MTCSQIANDLPLYVYGELPQEGEERVEHHLASCAVCAAELQGIRSLGSALTAAEMPVPDGLLEECRMQFTRVLREERARTNQPLRDWLARLRELMGMHIGFSVPAGAMALIAVGFLVGRFAPLGFATGAGPQQAGFVNIRSVEPDAGGKVRIAYDNVSQKTVTGSPDEPGIRALLLSSMKEQSNAGVRVEAAGIMKDHAANADVRNVLLEVVQHDPNIGVRITAAEGLRQYGADPEVRKAMTQVLLNDGNAGVRMKAIDLLTSQKDQSMVGPLQHAMQKEDNSYVRMRMQNTLREMNASAGDF